MKAPQQRAFSLSRACLTSIQRVEATGRLTAAAAVLITSATASGREIMITCEPSTSVMVATARSAIDRTTSVPAARSGDARTVQDGSDFQAGGPMAR